MQPFTLLIKPSGSDCNLNCRYCFYKCRYKIGQTEQRMSEQVLEKLVKDYLKLRFPTCGFAWQGGEPTLMGAEFFEKVIELQKQYGGAGQVVCNSLQTNGILLDEKWCRLLSRNKFLVGISLDGPKELHDDYRLDHSGRGTFDRVMRAIETCKRYNVAWNILVLLNDRNVQQPDALFDFFVEHKMKYLQLIPCVENDPRTGQLAEFSVSPEQYGEFLCRLFDRWYEYGPARLSIRDFDSMLNYYVNGAHTMCVFDKRCSDYIVIEYNGDAFACDFFVEPRWRLGNIFEQPIEALAGGAKKREFSRQKELLCSRCLACRHLQMCRGGCLKDRLAGNEGAFGRQSYLCGSYKRFFEHSLGRFMEIAAALKRTM